MLEAVANAVAGLGLVGSVGGHRYVDGQPVWEVDTRSLAGKFCKTDEK